MRRSYVICMHWRVAVKSGVKYVETSAPLMYEAWNCIREFINRRKREHDYWTTFYVLLILSLRKSSSNVNLRWQCSINISARRWCCS